VNEDKNEKQEGSCLSFCKQATFSFSIKRATSSLSRSERVRIPYLSFDIHVHTPFVILGFDGKMTGQKKLLSL
jgi:hypothetical protein